MKCEEFAVKISHLGNKKELLEIKIEEQIRTIHGRIRR